MGHTYKTTKAESRAVAALIRYTLREIGFSQRDAPRRIALRVVAFRGGFSLMW